MPSLGSKLLEHENNHQFSEYTYTAAYRFALNAF
jgi:hypothetical protein